MILKKKVKAYFTLEASFIIPITLFIFILVIYFTFFLFNHCVVKQSVYIAALRGQQMKNVSNSAIKEYVEEQLELLLAKQVYQYQIDYSAEVNYVDINVNAKSNIENKLSKMGIYKNSSLNSNGKKMLLRFYPAEFIRLSH